jgi:hypothetical protein
VASKQPKPLARNITFDLLRNLHV